MSADQPAWRWAREHLLIDALEAAAPDLRNDLIDALDEVLADPLAYGGFDWTELKGTRSRPGRFVVFLPHDYILVVTPYPQGIPPHAGPRLLVRFFASEFPNV